MKPSCQTWPFFDSIEGLSFYGTFMHLYGSFQYWQLPFGFYKPYFICAFPNGVLPALPRAHEQEE